MNRIQLFLLIIIASAIFASCDKHSSLDNTRTAEDIAALKATTDSVYEMSPKSKEMIAHGLENAKDSISYYEYYLQLAKYYFVTSRTDSTIPCAEKVLHFLKDKKVSPRINALKAGALETKADYYYQFHQYDKGAISLHKEAYQLLMNSDNKEFVPDVCANIADVYQQINDLPQSSVWYRRALFLVDSLQLPPTRNVTFYLGLAHVYQILNDYDRSEHFYLKTEKFYKELRPGMKVYFLNNFGNYFYYIKNYNKALLYFLRLKEVVEKYYSDKDYNMFLCYINLADVYLNLGQLDKATSYVEKAETYFTKNKVDIGIYYAKTIRIGIALKQNNLKLIKDILDKSKGNKILDPGLTSIRNKYVQAYYTRIGDYRNAYDNLHHSVMISDSIEKNRSYMRSSEILLRFHEDTLALHKKIALQQKDMEVKKTKNGLVISVFVTIDCVCYGDMDVLHT